MFALAIFSTRFLLKQLLTYFQIPTNATTEQRMIAGAVFGTLNEAWDKFRIENNL